MLILMLTTQFNAFFVYGLMLFFWRHNLKKPLRLTNTEVLSCAKHSAMCALSSICEVNDTDLCVATCRFSQAVFATSNNFTHNLLFYLQ